MEPDDDETQALAKLGAGPAAHEAYRDLLQPAARVLGAELQVAAKAVAIALLPLRGAVWVFDRLRDWLMVELPKRLADVDPQDVQSPAPNVAVPILQQIQLHGDDDQEKLREMFANLLAAAMNRRTATAVHPAFTTVIREITPDEVLILDYLARKGEEFQMAQMPAFGDPTKTRSLWPIVEQFRGHCSAAGSRNDELWDAYFDNMMRLRLLRESHDQRRHPEDMSDRPRYEDVQLVSVSPFGRAFLRVCTTEARTRARHDAPEG